MEEIGTLSLHSFLGKVVLLYHLGHFSEKTTPIKLCGLRQATVHSYGTGT